MKKNKKKKKSKNYKKQNQNLKNRTPKKELTDERLNKLVNETLEEIKEEKTNKVEDILLEANDELSKTFDEQVESNYNDVKLKKENAETIDPIDDVIDDNGWNIDAVGTKKREVTNVKSGLFTTEQVNHFIDLVDEKIRNLSEEELNNKLSILNKDDGVEPSTEIIKQVKNEEKLYKDIKKITDDKDNYEPSKGIVENYYVEQITNEANNKKNTNGSYTSKEVTNIENEQHRDEQWTYYDSVNNKVRRLDSILKSRINHDDVVKSIDEDESLTSDLLDKIDVELKNIEINSNNEVSIDEQDDELIDKIDEKLDDVDDISLNAVDNVENLENNEDSYETISNNPIVIDDTVDKLYNTNLNYDEMTSDPSDEKKKVNIDKSNEDLDATRALGILKPVDIDVEESDEMKSDNSVTEPLFDTPLTKEVIEKYNDNYTDDSKEIIKPVEIKNNKFNFGTIIWILIGLVVLGFILLNIFSKGTILNKFIANLSASLNVKNSELLDYELKFNVSGDKHYDFLNNTTINATLESDSKQFYGYIRVDNNDSEDKIDLNYYTKDGRGYLFDSKLSDKQLKVSKDYDFSVNSLKKNIILFLKQVNESNISDYVNNKVKGTDNELVLSITNTNIVKITDELKTIKLSSLYQDLLNKLIKDMIDNPSKYMGTKITLNMNVLGGLKKLVITGENTITLTKDSNSYLLENIDKNNTVTDIKVSNNNIKITKNRGSIVDLSLSIDMVVKEGTVFNKLMSPNDDNVIDMSNISSHDEFIIKKSISSSNNHNNFINFYYYLNGELNTINMNVSNDQYYVYYNVPEGYNSSNYNSESQKKYIDIDRTVIYSLRNYTYPQTMEYIAGEYQKEVDSLFYYDVKTTDVLNISHNDLMFNYQIVTKTYDSNYENYDTTSSTLYIWYQLNDNTIFMIEYEFQGNIISEEDIGKLLDIQVG